MKVGMKRWDIRRCQAVKVSSPVSKTSPKIEDSLRMVRSPELKPSPMIEVLPVIVTLTFPELQTLATSAAPAVPVTFR
jgi:hypothetical protein